MVGPLPGKHSVSIELQWKRKEKVKHMNDADLPIWFPEQGRAFIASVIETGQSCPDSVEDGECRTEFIFVAAHDIVCRHGGETGEEVKVVAGERFKMRSQLFLPLFDYVGLGNVGIASIKPTKSDSGEAAWEWAVRLSPAQKAKLADTRKAAELAAEPPIPF